MRVLIIILLLLKFQNNFAQNTIVMEYSNGVYLIPCLVNDIPMKFVFDTGASEVMISSTEALFLIKNGSITEDDILGSNNYKTASGEIIKGTRIILKKIQINDLVLENVNAAVVHNNDAPLLLGQNVIKKLGKITIEDNLLTIQKLSNNKTNCDYLEVSPFKIGMSKFDISLIEGKSDVFSRISSYSKLPDSMKGIFSDDTNTYVIDPRTNKKVLYTYLNLYKTDINCIRAKELQFHLELWDDSLFEIVISADYDDLNLLLKDYDLLNEMVPDDYLYVYEENLLNSYTEQKVGESKVFYRVPKEKALNGSSPVLDLWRISYRIEYNEQVNRAKSTVGSLVSDGTIKNFRLTLKILDESKL